MNTTNMIITGLIVLATWLSFTLLFYKMLDVSKLTASGLSLFPATVAGLICGAFFADDSARLLTQQSQLNFPAVIIIAIIVLNLTLSVYALGCGVEKLPASMVTSVVLPFVVVWAVGGIATFIPDGKVDLAQRSQVASKGHHENKQLTTESTPTSRDKVSEQAHEYQQGHPDEKVVKIDFSTGGKAKEGYSERLMDAPDIQTITQVFYIDRDGKVTSGDKYDYHEALKSKNVVYVFVK